MLWCSGLLRVLEPARFETRDVVEDGEGKMVASSTPEAELTKSVLEVQRPATSVRCAGDALCENRRTKVRVSVLAPCR